jgi:hypothetical protein
MTEVPLPSDGANAPRDLFPPVGKEVLVRHNGSKRMAYRDAEGKWRDFHDGEVLPGEVVMVRLD